MIHNRRSSDRRGGDDRRQADRAAGHGVRTVTWDDQRPQFLTRYLFWALYLAYFNLGAPIARDWPGMAAVNVVAVVYFCLVSVYLLHARRHTHSPLRWRIAMWTDLVMVSVAAVSDSTVMSPAYLAFIMVILGNGMRYGLRFFAEAVVGTFALVVAVLLVRFTDYREALSITTVFFLAFFSIIVVYAYTLMTRIEKTRRQLEAESSIDILTGLLNRRGLYEKANGVFQSLEIDDRCLAILFADLDGFKTVNDIHGHHVGDRVLRQVASLIHASVRDTDIAARFGGDEFVIILPDASGDQAISVAERLQAAVHRWSRDGGVTLSLSIGMGEAPIHGRDLNDVLERVDLAMYQCKQTFGRGGIRRADDTATN